MTKTIWKPQEMIYTKNGKSIVFDEFTDERGQDYGGIWAGMCERCARKYRDILTDKLDDCGSGCCSVKGCDGEADYYVDFWYDDDIKIVEVEG